MRKPQILLVHGFVFFCCSIVCNARINAQDAAVASNQKAADLKKMVGKWSMVKATLGGQAAPPQVLNMVLDIKANKKIEMRGGPKEVDFKFDIEPGKKHHKLSMEATTGDKIGEKAIGFYKFEKDLLHLYLPNQPNADNPPTEPNDRLAHLVLKKAEEEKTE